MTINPNASALRAAASLRSRIFAASAGAAFLVAASAIPATAATPQADPQLGCFGTQIITEGCSPNGITAGPSSLALPVTAQAVSQLGNAPVGDDLPPEEEPCLSCT
jgi:hypothetical protein